MNKNDQLAEGLPLPKLRGRNGSQMQSPPVDNDQGEFLFDNPFSNKQNERENINKKINLIQKLLKKYESMSTRCQVQVEPVRDYLLKHLGLLIKLREEAHELTTCAVNLTNTKSNSSNNNTNGDASNSATYEFDGRGVDVQQSTCVVDADSKLETEHSTASSVEARTDTENAKFENAGSQSHSKAYGENFKSVTSYPYVESIDKKQNLSQNFFENEFHTETQPLGEKLEAQNGDESNLLKGENKVDFDDDHSIQSNNKKQEYEEKTLTEQQHSQDSSLTQHNKDVANDTSGNEEQLFEKNMRIETNHETEPTLKGHGVFAPQLETKSFITQNDATPLDEDWKTQNKSTENYKSQDGKSQTKNQIEIVRVTATSLDKDDKILHENSSSVTIATIDSKINDRGNFSYPNIVSKDLLDLGLSDSHNFLPKFDVHGMVKEDIIKSELNAAKSSNKHNEECEKGLKASKHERNRWSKEATERLSNDGNVVDTISKLYDTGKKIRRVENDFRNSQGVSDTER